MTEPVDRPTLDPTILERVLLHGDLRQLSPAQKTSYYHAVCRSLGLNPLTQPFAYLVLNGKEVLYAKREATEQLRKLHTISLEITARELIGDVYVVTARASTTEGRRDESTGAVAVGGQKGEALANAYLKAETKAKRRVTLSICGLGMLDESETDSLREATEPMAAPSPVLPAAVVDVPVKPEGYDRWLEDLVVAAESGETVLRAAWKESATAPRQYLLATEPESWASLKARAAAVDAAAATGFPAEIVG